MTEYKLNPFTMADAQALAGQTADITEWDDDELERKVTYPGARITGIIVLSSPCLVIETAGAVLTDARTGERLGTRPPEPELRLFFTWVCEVDGVRGRFERGERVALEHTDDPDTRLRPGDEGTVTRYHAGLGQLDVRWDSGSTLSMLPGEGDQVRLLARAAGEDGTEPEDPEGPGDGEPAPDFRQDITDPATGLSRLLSERCPTCILRSGDPMHLGPDRTAVFIRQVLGAGSYVVCHDTLTYGDFPDYAPAICRGFFEAYRTRDLLILRAGRRLTEVPPPIVAKAAALGRDAGQAAAGRLFDGALERVLRGIDDGDPAVLDAIEPPAIGPGAGYTEDDLARDLGIGPRDRALPRAVAAYADAFTGSFRQETERAAREHAG